MLHLFIIEYRNLALRDGHVRRRLAFAFVNILENPEIRATLPKIANWPTFPQLWIDGELMGGSDIILQMYQSGELKPLVEANSPAA